ncbi:MAG: Holliday junction branch migration protein RuvA [bacterium]|nr:Holliday junction branch migration protein RuvA [bacterium]
MYEFIEGKVEHANPAFIVINANGIGYHIQISINTYEQFKNMKDARVLTYLAIKEDGHFIYGFFDEIERQLFKQLISVNGVGTNTARMILSGQSPNEIISAITTGNIATLKAVKGVGPKTAQRIILELQDKMAKMSTPGEMGAMPDHKNKAFDEALLALQALGFQRAIAEKVLLKVTNNNKLQIGVEDMIKQSLKAL